VKTITTVERERERARQLRSMKWRATSLLIAAAVVFVVARRFEPDHDWLGYVRATAEAAMVGGLADWFAVTALFRHPLRLPIPHTAVIKTRKAQLGHSLGEFVQENFLAREVVAEKLRHARVGERLGPWLRDPVHARDVSRHTSAALAGALDVLDDDAVQGALEHGVSTRLRQIEASPTLGRVLAIATADGRHRELVDAAAVGALRFLNEHRGELRERFARESPWWVPEPIDDRIFDKIFRGLATFLQDVIEDPTHELRQHLDRRLDDLIARLGSDPALIARGEKFKEEILAHPAVRTWMGSLWADLKRALVEQSGDPDSELRRRIEQTAVAFGDALSSDPTLRGKLDGWIESAAGYVVDAYRHEVADLIETTVAKWDADEAARRIELQVGRDLQFIRINGTIVGGIAGLAIHAIGKLIV
jgi:uncharacterized membrane-anchored protein YjiN (DUF445 family)